MDKPGDDETARNRWLTMQVLRVAGVAITLIGIVMREGRLGGDTTVAYALIVIGIFGIFVVPLMLARRWRTPRR